MLRRIKPHPVLHVDDEEPNLAVFVAAFGDDHEIICASSGEEALRILDERPISVLVTDHRMPGMSGVELCAAVREHFPHIIRLLVTAYSEHQTVIDAINRGRVHSYVPKPWDAMLMADMLAEAVAQATRERAAADLRTVVRENEIRIQRTLLRTLYLPDVEARARSARECAGRVAAEAPEGMAALCQNLLQEIDALATSARIPEDPIEALPDLHEVADILALIIPILETDLVGSARLVIDCPDGIPVFVDHILLSAALLNIAQHSATSMRISGVEWGEVRIAARDADDNVFIDVADQAPPLANQQPERLFDPVWGGVNLAVAKELADACGCTLGVGDPDGERGNILRITVPKTE